MEELRSNTEYLIGVTDRRRVAARPRQRVRGAVLLSFCIGKAARQWDLLGSCGISQF